MRRSIHVAGFEHANPIPAASRIGPFVFSGAITGRDPHTRELPAGLDAQCAHVFRHVRAIIEAAGGTVDDIAKLTFWLRDHHDRDALNREWLAMFPDPDSRPARHAVAATLAGGTLIQADFIAVCGYPAAATEQ
ncbi:RidA family protein [Actinoplanes sp. RD1]|uniref:RidA family protein n=1 Tax=Actinoplanes sp. RD1 TaxID=3064538 RepID=UPI002740F79A|nr:RidA family protein [Actinoplanes sp. RD1]